MKLFRYRVQRLTVIASVALAIFAKCTSHAAEPTAVRAARVIKCETTGDAHPAVVTSVAITADGKKIAAATDEHHVLVWDADTAELKSCLKGHGDWVRSVVLSEDGGTLASGAGDRALRTWNVLECCPAMNIPACDNTVAGVCFHPSGEQLAVVGFCNELKIVDASSGQVSRELECPCTDVRAVAISPDGQRMAAAGRNGTVRVWNAADGAEDRDVETDGRCIRALAFSPDGRYLAAAGTGPSIRVFDTATGETAMTLSTRPAKNFSLAFLDNNRLASGGTDNRVLIWDLTSRQVVSQLVGHTGTVAALASSPDGTTLVSGGYDTTIRIWELSAGAAPSTASRTTTDSAR